MNNSIFNLDFRYPNFKVKENKLKNISENLGTSSYKVKSFYENHAQYLMILDNPVKAFEILEIPKVQYNNSVYNINKIANSLKLNAGDVVPTLGYLKSMEYFILNQFPELSEIKSESKDVLEVFDLPFNISLSDLLLTLYEKISDRFPTVEDFCALPELRKYNLDSSKFSDNTAVNFSSMTHMEHSEEYQGLLAFSRIKKDFDYYKERSYNSVDLLYKDIYYISLNQKVYSEFKDWIKYLKDNTLASFCFKKNYLGIIYVSSDKKDTSLAVYKDLGSILGFSGFGMEIKSSNLPLVLKNYLLLVIATDNNSLDFDKTMVNFCFSKDLKPYMVEFIDQMRSKGVIVRKKDDLCFSLHYDYERILKNDISLNEISSSELDSILFKK